MRFLRVAGIATEVAFGLPIVSSKEPFNYPHTKGTSASAVDSAEVLKQLPSKATMFVLDHAIEGFDGFQPAFSSCIVLLFWKETTLNRLRLDHETLDVNVIIPLEKNGSRCLPFAASSPDLLQVFLRRIGLPFVDDKADVWDVYPHAERLGADHRVELRCELPTKPTLDARPLEVIQAAVEEGHV